MNSSGSRVYAVSQGAVAVIDTGTNSVVSTIPIGNLPFSASLPLALAVNPAGTYFYVATGPADVTMGEDGVVLVIDTKTNRVVNTITVGKSGGIAVDPKGTYVYVAAAKGVAVINTKTNSVVNTVKVKAVPQAIAVNPSGTYIYVTTGNSVSVIQTGTYNVIATVRVPYSAYAVAVNPEGTYVYVTVNGGTVCVIDTSTNSIVATIPVGKIPIDIAIGGFRSHIH